MFKLLKKLIVYFRTIEIYEKKKIYFFKCHKSYKFKVYKSFKSIKSKTILNYFEKYKNKKKRFIYNHFFLTLSFKENLVSSGWLCKKNNWNISEIDHVINVKNKYVIFDFMTPFQFRNKGYYTKLLKFVRSKFSNKNILIYVLSSNKKSKKAIKKAGFNLKYKINKFK